MFKFMLIIFVVVASFLYFYARLKTEKPIAHLKRNGALKGIIFAFVFFAVGAALLYAADARSSDRVKYLHYSTIYAGLEQQLGGSVFCHNDGISDKLTSNLGLKQGLLKYKGASVYAQYTHHSCALNKDRPTYDAVGLGVEYTIDWSR